MIEKATLKKIGFLFLLWIGIGNALSLNAQQVHYQNFDITDGLPSTEFYDVHQDASAYVWFCSDRGMVRYNGYEFENFSLEDGLSNLVNFTFFPDTPHTFWLNGFDGSFTFWNGQQFVPFKYNAQLRGLARAQNIWFLISEIDEQFIYFFAVTAPSFKGFRINRNTGELKNLEIQELPISKHCSSITKRTILWHKEYGDRRKNIINKVIMFSKQAITSASNLEIPTINNELLNEKNELYLMTDKGIFIYPDADYSQTPKRLLADFGITSIATLSDGRIWATSNTNGLFYIPSTDLQVLPAPPNENDNFAGLYPGDGFLMAKNVEGKVFTLSENLSFLPNIYHTNKSLFNYHKDPFDLSAFNFGGMAFRKEKMSNQKDKSLLHYRINERLSLYYGFIGFRLTTSDSKAPPWLLAVPTRTFCAASTKQGDLLLGTLNGLIRIDQQSMDKEQPVTEYIPDLEGVRISDITSFETGAWLATIGHGLIFWNEDRIQKIEDPQISSDVIHSLYLQNDSTLWVGTNNGLNRIHYQISNNKIQVSALKKITTSHGLSSNYIKDIEEWEGKIWLATDNGLCYFDPSILQRAIAIPTLHLDQLVVNGKSIQLGDSTLSFSHEQNDIQIFYTGISQDKPIDDNFFYRYRLQNQDEKEKEIVNWVYTNNRNIELYNMPPGNYCFFVQCRNINNQWSPLLPIPFNIRSHFTQTWWFRSLVALGLALLLFLIWNYRSKRLKDQISLDLRLKTAELTTLRNQMNPHFVFNSLNAIQNYIFKGNPEEANLYIHSFSRLMRKSLQFSRLDKISIAQEINFIEEYMVLEKMRFRDKFDFSIDAGEIKRPEQITIPALLIQPIVENAVKYAFRNFSGIGFIDISYRPHPSLKAIIVTIADNGVGIDPTKKSKAVNSEHQSLGLQIIRQRLDLFNEQLGQKIGQLTFLNKGEPGTTIEIILPIFES